jgi:hypothetical protein
MKLICEYYSNKGRGWIPLCEFEKLPKESNQEFLNLCQSINIMLPIIFKINMRSKIEQINIASRYPKPIDAWREFIK